MKSLVKLLNISVIQAFKPFVYKRLPIREFFAINDGGLHLNFEGSKRLEKFFRGTVKHLSN